MEGEEFLVKFNHCTDFSGQRELAGPIDGLGSRFPVCKLLLIRAAISPAIENHFFCLRASQ